VNGKDQFPDTGINIQVSKESGLLTASLWVSTV